MEETPSDRTPRPWEATVTPNALLERNFTYHAPNPAQQVNFQQLRDEAKRLAYLIITVCPAGREQSLAITSLETAIFWANAAIARS